MAIQPSRTMADRNHPASVHHTRRSMDPLAAASTITPDPDKSHFGLE
jgi:hypothetical protein